MDADASLVPALEIAVTAIALIQGFAAARDHAHLNSARELAHRLGETLSQPSSATTTSGRAQAQELLQLARGGLEPDPLVHRVVLLACAWVAATTAIGIVGVVAGLLGEPVAGVIIAITATAITGIVATLGKMDSTSVNKQLRAIQTGTTVGLLAAAIDGLETGSGDGPTADGLNEAIRLSSLAATRNPRLAWPPLIRAQAYSKLNPPNLDAADADIRRVYQADPGQAAGMFDEIARRHGLDPTAATVDWFRQAYSDSPLEARRRFVSAMSGYGRRLAERESKGGANDRDPLTVAAQTWREGDLLRARDTLTHALDSRDAPTGAAPLLALLLNSLGDHTAALDVLQDTGEEGDWRLLGYIARADALVALGRDDEVEATLTRLRRERPRLGELTSHALQGP